MVTIFTELRLSSSFPSYSAMSKVLSLSIEEPTPTLALDPADLDVEDDLAEEAETVSNVSSSHGTLFGKSKTGDILSQSMRTGITPQQREEALGNILEAASKAVQEKTDIAYRGYDNISRCWIIPDAFY